MGDGLQYPTQAQHQSPSYESMGETAPARLDTSNTSDTNNIFDNNHINDADVVNVVVNNRVVSDSNVANVVVNINNNDNNVEKNLLNATTTTTTTTIPISQSTITNDVDTDSRTARLSNSNKAKHEKDLHFIDEGFSSGEKLRNNIDDDDDDSIDGNSKLWAVKSNASLIASAPATPTITTSNHIIDM